MRALQCSDQTDRRLTSGALIRTRPPRVLELISVNHFPGSRRFIGLGQLPREMMWMLWNTREVIEAERLSLGAAAWAALTADDPRALAAISSARERLRCRTSDRR